MEDNTAGTNGTNALRVLELPPIPTPTLGDSGQTVLTPAATLAGLQVSRSVTVPNTGSQDFARTVDTFTNPTAADITTPVTIIGNLGSDAATNVFATSDGDTTVDPGDEWVGTDGGGSLPVIEIIHGPRGLKPTSVAVIGDNSEWTYNLTVPAGQTVRLATFTVLALTEAEAIAAADTLMQPAGFGGNAGEFLSASDVASLANVVFDTPPTTTSTIPDVSVNEDTTSSVVPLWNYFTDVEDGSSGLTYAVQSVTGTASLLNSTNIDVATGNLTLAYADGPTGSDAVTIRATDTNGLCVDSTFNVTVNPKNEPPTLDAIGDLHINEDDSQQTVYLTGISPGPADEAGQSLTITATSDNTALIPDPTVNHTAGNTIGTLTFQALPTSGTATVTVTVQDNGGTANGGSDTVTRTFRIYVNPEPVRPIIDTSFTPLLPAIHLPIKTGTFPPSAPISDLGAHTTNPDVGDPKGVALVGVDPAAGQWQYALDGGTTWTNVPAVAPTGALLLPGDANTALRLLPGPKFKNKYTFVSYRAWDQSNGKTPGTLDDVTGPTATAYSLETEQAWVAVGKPKPVVDAAGDPELTPTRPLLEDHKSRAFTVKKFLGLLGLAEKQVDPTKTYGIAVSGNTGGTWEFNTGKVGWQPIGNVSNASALLLRPTDKVKYIPTLNFNGTATLTYHTWDQSNGTAGTTADTAGAAFSAETEKAVLTVAPVNDPPVIDVTQQPGLGMVAPGGATASQTVAGVLAGVATDVDNPSIGIELLPASTKVGVWQYSTDGGATWQTATKPTELAATAQIRFQAAAGAKAGSYTVPFKAWDGTAKGGTAMSKATGTATLEIA
jgi:hypothetical protein